MRRNSGAAACHVCKHREHAAIDLALARGVSLAALAKRYGIGSDSLYRHRRAHLSPQLRARLLAGARTEVDLDRLRESETQSWLAHLVALRHRLFAQLDAFEEGGDGFGVTRTSGEIHRNLEMVGKHLDQLGTGSVTNNINITVLPEWTTVRTRLLDAAAAYPEARFAIAAVISRVESKSAAVITADASRPMFDVTPRKVEEPA